MSSALAAASLILKPEGYSEGRLQTLKPIEKLGSELVTNGTFDTNSNWNLTSGGTDANISNGKANFVNAVKGQRVQQNFNFTAAKTYKVAFTVSNYTSGLLGFYMGGTYAVSNINANGTYTYLVTPTNNSESFLRAMQTGVSHNFSVDNVSVKEVLAYGGDFTFTRGSNLSATRVNSAGLIEKGRENLLLQSNHFDTTWTLSSTSVTSGQAGYDGSSDAWLLNSTTTGFPRIAQNVTSSGVSTFSVYAKPATDGFILMRTFGADSSVWFDLTNGTIPNAAGSQYITSNIQSVGNGWYRCSVIVNGSLTSLRIYPASAYGVYSTSGNGVYIQDAQLEAGMVATNYIETGASTVKAGILENTPRLDYSGGATEPSLLLEPSRTNAVQSEYFGVYTNSNSTDEPNATTSPEGLTNATSFLEAATTGQHKLATSYGFDGSSTYTFSIFAKYNGRDLFVDTQNSNEWGGRAWFDLTAGTANAVLGTADIEDFGNGWYRCIVTGASTLAGGNQIELLTSDGSTNSTTGDITKGVYIYGAQLEEGSYPTSYIPTYGSSVTRGNDETYITGLQSKNIITSTQGTMFFHITDIQGIAVVFNAQNADNLNYALRFILRDIGFQTLQRVNDVQTSIRTNYSLTISEWKIAMSWNGTNLITSFNGTSYIDTIDASISSQLDKIARVNPTAISVTTNQILVFPTQLTEAELNDLTTL